MTTKDVLYILIIVLLLFLGFRKPTTITKTDIVEKWDTLLISRIDTLVIIKDSIVYLPDSTKLYTSTFTDEFINIRVKSHVDGMLLGQTFQYDLKLPQLTVIKYPKYNYVYAGLDVNLNSVAPRLTFIDKNKNMFSVSYSTNNQLTLGYSRQLFKY
jgi:hypothetical protein